MPFVKPWSDFLDEGDDPSPSTFRALSARAFLRSSSSPSASNAVFGSAPASSWSSNASGMWGALRRAMGNSLPSHHDRPHTKFPNTPEPSGLISSLSRPRFHRPAQRRAPGGGAPEKVSANAVDGLIEKKPGLLGELGPAPRAQFVVKAKVRGHQGCHSLSVSGRSRQAQALRRRRIGLGSVCCRTACTSSGRSCGSRRNERHDRCPRGGIATNDDVTAGFAAPGVVLAPARELSVLEPESAQPARGVVPEDDPAIALPSCLPEGVGSHAVGGTEIDALGVVAILPIRVDFTDLFSGYGGRGDRVEVEPVLEHLPHRVVARDVRSRA